MGLKLSNRASGSYSFDRSSSAKNGHSKVKKISIESGSEERATEKCFEEKKKCEEKIGDTKNKDPLEEENVTEVQQNEKAGSPIEVGAAQKVELQKIPGNNLKTIEKIR